MPALLEPTPPNEEESRLARQCSIDLAPHLTERRNLRVRIEGDATNQVLELPVRALHLLAGILSEMAEGNAVTLLPIHAELTTQQAADFLGMSRPFLIQMLEDGHMPFRKVGTHRRIFFRDVLTYKRRTDEKRQASLRELAALSQEFDLGY